MKQTVIHKALAIMLALAAPSLAGAVSVAATPAANKVVKLNFDESMFKIDETDGLVNSIQYVKSNSSMPGDTSAPALPLVYFRVAAPGGVDCTFSPRILSQKLLMSNVDISVAPEIIPTNQIGKISAEPKSKRYEGAMYPAEICTKNSKSQWSDATVFHFACSPFVYDGKRRNLYLIQEMEVDVNFTDLPAEKLNYVRTQMTRMPEFLKGELDTINTRWKDSLINVRDTVNELEPLNPSIGELDLKINYLIITSEALKPAFEPLLKWKRTKGLYTAIATVENIAKQYSGKDLPAKIKKYLKEQALNYRVEYVLLGGDDSVVPPRYTRGRSGAVAVPADMYYTILNDPYDWDRNGNGIYGERKDSISYQPSLAVTRAPVRTIKDVNSFVNRTIEYERFPLWSNNLLFTGTKMDSQTYPEPKFNTLYTRYIKDYWTGETEEYFDTEKGMIELGDTIFTSENLERKIAQGYNFISIMTHGQQRGLETWTRNDKRQKDLYWDTHAHRQTNASHTIITTSACMTNAFDCADTLNLDPCLAESLFRNPSSGIIGYYGESRYSTYEVGKGFGGTMAQEGDFYMILFSDGLKNKNFGEVVAKAKFSRVKPSKYLRTYPDQFSLNALGDPEMPIFTREPMEFNNVTANCEGNTIEISTGEPDCRISVRGLGNKTSFSRVFNQRESVEVKNLPDQFTVCITKQNFKPWLYSYNKKPDGSYKVEEVTTEQFSLDNLGLQKISGQITDIKSIDDGGATSTTITYEISTLVSESANSVILTVSKTNPNGSVVMVPYNIETGECATRITIDDTLVRFPFLSDFTVINLIVDGEVQDTKKIYHKN